MKRRGFIKNSLAAAIPLVTPFPFGEFLSSPEKVKNLIFIQLAGGNDGYNTLVPYTSEEYYVQRPSLAIPANEVIRLTDAYGLNPALYPLLSYYKRGEVLLVNYVGTAEDEPSHYAATEGWSSTFQLPEEESSDFSFKDQLNSIASAISSGGRDIHFATLDGFDTHQFQRIRHDNLLKEYADGLQNFIDNLKKQNTFKETLIITWSEFGRSFKQNNKKGTDHGNENMMIVSGGALKQQGIINAKANVLLSPGDVHKILIDKNFA